MKKVFAGVLALALTVSGVLCGCSEEKSATSQKENVDLKNTQGSKGFTYVSLTEYGSSKSYFDLGKYEGGIVITGYVGNETDIVIPEEIDGKPVVGINDFAFCPLRFTDYGDGDYDFYRDDLGKDFTSEDIEQVQEFIENHDKYSRIKSIQIPSTIVWCGEDPFLFCDSLETVKIYGESNAIIYHIDNKLFNYCYSLKEIEGTVRYIGMGDEIQEVPLLELWADYEEPQETTGESDESITSQ